MPEPKRLKSLPEQKRDLVARSDSYRADIGAGVSALTERWADQHTHWYVLAGTAIRNLVFSQFNSRWERGVAALYTTWTALGG